MDKQKTVKDMVVEFICIQMETCTMGNGESRGNTVAVFILIPTAKGKC